MTATQTITPARRNTQHARRARVTIGDVASALGLTKGTVSRALNGYPDISESTRLRVARMATDMGYRPLTHAQAIRTGRVRALGLVLQSDKNDGHRPFIADFLSGVTAGASAENWTVTIAMAASKLEVLDTIARLVEEHKADGFILPRTLIDDPRISYLKQVEQPFVLFGRTRDSAGCAWFDILGEEAMRDAVLRLARLGHQRIGFINGGAEYNYSGLRLAGYRQGLAAAGLNWESALVRENAVTEEEGALAGESLLKMRNPPTAIVCAVDRAAIGLYPATARMGLQIGREVSIISYDGIPEGAYARPPLTSFAVDSRHAGERLARLLIDRIRGVAPEDLRELVPAALVERGSDRPPALSSEELGARLREIHV